MPIKDILTVVDLSGERTATTAAVEIARQLDAHLSGLSLALEPEVPVFDSTLSSETVASLRGAYLDQAKAADNAFRDIARRADIRHEGVVADVTFDGYFPEILQHSRLTDLIVIGQENPGKPEPMRRATIERLLFDGGAPLFLIPYVGTKRIQFDHALVAWDGSATSARAVRAGLPLLELSRKVTVLSVSRDRWAAETGLAAYLDRHGLDVEVELFPRNEVPVADLLLNTVAEHGIDWVAMGGYGHTRIGEMVFGGVTRDILREMTAPVLMAH